MRNPRKIINPPVLRQKVSQWQAMLNYTSNNKGKRVQERKPGSGDQIHSVCCILQKCAKIRYWLIFGSDVKVNQLLTRQKLSTANVMPCIVKARL